MLSAMRFWKKRPTEHRPDYTGPIDLKPVGYARNDITMPRPRGWESVESTIEFAPEHAQRIEGLGAYSHAIVVFYMDMATGAPEFPEQITLASGNTYGIFATRSQLRPNHLGVTVVPILEVDGRFVRVRGLDAIDGTAVLDIKPYLPEYDAVPGARIPSLS